MTHLTAWTFVEALLWGLASGLVAWFATLWLRRRSLNGLVTSLLLTGAATSAGLLWGGEHAMLLPGYNWLALLTLSAFAVAVTGVAAVAVGRRLSHDHEALRIAASEFGDGLIPTTEGRRLTAQVERTRAELRASAQRLAEARTREMTLESARRELVAWVSHDLRAPLAGLRAMAEALEDGVVDDPEAYYKRIAVSVEHLDRMVGDLFELSRIQSGGGAAHLERISLDDLVSDCVATLEPVAEVRGVGVVGAADRPAIVTGDGAGLNRALSNLVANAIRHTAAGETVTVRVGGATPDSPETAVVTVRDGCGGIPDEHLARVFDVGFRGEPARTRGAAPVRATGAAGSAGPGGERPGGEVPGGGVPGGEVRHGGGAGLGLAITRGIVEAHHGEVSVRNVAGGCEFRVVLPALPA